MCVIIDANVGSSILSEELRSDFGPVFDWLESKGAVVYGGRLAGELQQIHGLWRYLLELRRAGRAFAISDEQVDEETNALKLQSVCQSNDEHIVALARVSGARTLVSLDVALHADFTSPTLVAKPRGRVYQNRSHRKLLCHSVGCPGRHRA